MKDKERQADIRKVLTWFSYGKSLLGEDKTLGEYTTQ